MEVLTRALPSEVAEVYRFSNGMTALGGNLAIEPLEEMVGFSGRLRTWDWPIPDEVVVFGGNGGDELFGLWLPPDARTLSSAPVVMIGSVFEPACMALVGRTVSGFLRAWSGHYLDLLDAPQQSFAALGLPVHLRGTHDQSGWAPYFEWADPSLPDYDPDPYSRGLDARGIAGVIG